MKPLCNSRNPIIYIKHATLLLVFMVSTVPGQDHTEICSTAAGDCCSANDSPGCNISTCCETVCACDSFCCEVEWDDKCATTGSRNDCGALLLCTFCTDSDGDGISDVNDICCDTPPNIMVDENGQPIGDVDNDCDVDLADFALLQQNLSGFLDAAGSCCADNPSLCDDNNLCTTDLCDSTSGVCTHQTMVTCIEGWFCNPLTGRCERIPCYNDADCDDGIFCNGVEICQLYNGSCSRGSRPCIDCLLCDESTHLCYEGDHKFTLTTDVAGDAITGTVCNDTFNAPVGTLQTVDIVVGNGGNDTMNAVVAGAASTNATLIDIDTVNLTTLNHVTFSATNAAAIGVWNILSGSTGPLTMTGAEADPVFTLGSGYARMLSVMLANATGVSDMITVTLNGTATGAGIATPNNNDLETLNIIVAADSSITAATPGTSFFGMAGALNNANNVIVTGPGMLTWAGGVAGDLVADTYDFAGFTGNTAASMANNPGATNVSTLPRFVGYTINDTAGGQNHSVTFANTHNNVTVDVNTIPALAALGTLALIQGANNNDSITVNFGGAGMGSGAITAAATEHLTINSGGTTANAIANVTTNTGVPFLTTTLIVTGTQNITLGTVTTEKLDATGLEGTMGVTAAASMQILGGTNDDTITGSGAVDLIDGNGGNDVIFGAAGADTIDGGTGNDSIDGGAGIDIVTGGIGVDTLRISAAAANGADRALFSDFDDTATTGDMVNINTAVATLTGTDNFATATSIQTHSFSGNLTVLDATEVVVVTSATVANLTAFNSLNGTNLIIAIGGAITGAIAGQNNILFAVADDSGNVGIYYASSPDNTIFAAEITLIAVLSGANVTLANMVFNNFSNAP